MIRSIFKTVSGMVMVFDEKGQEIPEYQGQYEAKRKSILRDAPANAEFYDEVKAVRREEW